MYRQLISCPASGFWPLYGIFHGVPAHKVGGNPTPYPQRDCVTMPHPYASAAGVVTSYTQTIINWRPTCNHWLAKSHITLISADNRWHNWLDIVGSCTWIRISCRNRFQERCQSADIAIADVLCVSVIYIGYYMLFGYACWWIVMCGWRFGLFILINTTIDRYYCSLSYSSRQNWRIFVYSIPKFVLGGPIYPW